MSRQVEEDQRTGRLAPTAAKAALALLWAIAGTCEHSRLQSVSLLLQQHAGTWFAQLVVQGPLT